MTTAQPGHHEALQALVRFTDDARAEGTTAELERETTLQPRRRGVRGELRDHDADSVGRRAPLVELLSEIRCLGDLRERGQISRVEYERRRRQVLERI